MGHGGAEDIDWHAYSKKHVESKATVDDIFVSKKLDTSLNPHGVKIRESCDSTDNPNSTALIFGFDVTGSMDRILDSLARTSLKTLVTEIHARKPVSDPHMMFMGIGDVEAGDKSPLQVTQFEADQRITEQLLKIHLERRGGSNSYESYALAWYFAAMHTRIDCFEKRNKKGLIFTIGDEFPTPYLTASDIKKVTGDTCQFDRITGEDLLTMVSRQYEVYHIVLEEGNCVRHYGDEVLSAWTKLLGQRAVPVANHKNISEVIVSLLQAHNGESHDKIISSWDGSTALAVAKALSNVPAVSGNGKQGLVRF